MHPANRTARSRRSVVPATDAALPPQVETGAARTQAEGVGRRERDRRKYRATKRRMVAKAAALILCGAVGSLARGPVNAGKTPNLNVRPNPKPIPYPFPTRLPAPKPPPVPMPPSPKT